MISQTYAMAPRPQGDQPPQGGFFTMLFPLVVIFAIFYFLIIRPQKRKEQTHRKFLESLKKGDEVVTQSGIYGRITGVAEQVVTLEIADKVKIKVAKASIAGVQPVQTSAAKA